MSSAAHIRRAKKYGVEFERFEDEEVLERDGYVCQCGCGKPCDRTQVVPEPDAPTLGHIIAMTCGGPHTRANTQCQRWECNARQNHETDTPKGAKIKRLRGETGQLKRRKTRGYSLIQGKTTIDNRGFDKSLRKKFNGQVERRNG